MHKGFFKKPPQVDADNFDDVSTVIPGLSAADKKMRAIAVWGTIICVVGIGGYWGMSHFTDFNGPPAEVMENSTPDETESAPESAASGEDDTTEAAEEGESAEATGEQEVAAEGAEESATDEASAEGAEEASVEEASAEGSEEAATEEASAEGAEEASVEEASAEGAEEAESAGEEAAATPQVVDAERGAELANQAFSAMNRSRNEEARTLAQQAVALDPTSSKAWLVLGYTSQVLGNAEGAAEAFRRCVDQGQGSHVRDCRSLAR